MSTASDGLIIFTVSDTGIGIPSDRFGELFKPFAQIDSGLDRRHEGSGLGLAIAHRLTELLHGTLKPESTLGQVTSFHVRLPSLSAEDTP